MQILEKIEKCDWYESLKLFRQKSMGDWNSVIEQVGEKIKKGLEVKAKRSSK